MNATLLSFIEKHTSNSSASTSDAIVCNPPPGMWLRRNQPQQNLDPPMSFLTGLARSSKRSLALCSSRIGLSVVAKTVPVPATLRRNGTNQPGNDIPLWKGITVALERASPITRQRDTTPDQAWERRSAVKFAKNQQALFPGPSTGKLTRSTAPLFYLLPTFLFTLTFF